MINSVMSAHIYEETHVADAQASAVLLFLENYIKCFLAGNSQANILGVLAEKQGMILTVDD